MEHNKRIKLLADQLVKAISQAYTDNQIIQEALNQIEEEGYQVDILLAAFTRVDCADEDDADGGTERFSSDQIASSILNIGGQASEDEESLDEDGLPLSAEINDFDRTFAKLIKVNLDDED
jgi:hypothetical protein